MLARVVGLKQHGRVVGLKQHGPCALVAMSRHEFVRDDSREEPRSTVSGLLL